MKSILQIICMIVLAFCTTKAHPISFKNLDKRYVHKESTDDVIVIMGVKKRYRVAIARGTIVDGKVAVGRGASINTYPQNGYIVGKLKPTKEPDEYHIQMVLPEGIGAFTPAYALCGDIDVLSFQAPAGKIIYLGDIDFQIIEETLVPIQSYDFDSAKNFMEIEYPSLAMRMDESNFTRIPLHNSMCPPEDREKDR